MIHLPCLHPQTILSCRHHLVYWEMTLSRLLSSGKPFGPQEKPATLGVDQQAPTELYTQPIDSSVSRLLRDLNQAVVKSDSKMAGVPGGG